MNLFSLTFYFLPYAVLYVITNKQFFRKSISCHYFTQFHHLGIFENEKTIKFSFKSFISSQQTEKVLFENNFKKSAQIHWISKKTTSSASLRELHCDVLKGMKSLKLVFRSHLWFIENTRSQFPSTRYNAATAPWRPSATPPQPHPLLPNPSWPPTFLIP